jgi:hypothetical protein
MEPRNKEYPPKNAAWAKTENRLLAKSVACPKSLAGVRPARDRRTSAACGTGLLSVSDTTLLSQLVMVLALSGLAWARQAPRND